MATALIVLAAGQGTRMNSDRAKVLHRLGGAPLLVHAMAAGDTLEPEARVVVVGHEGAAVAAAAKTHDPDVSIAWQTEQLGTGHAVQAAREALSAFEGDVVVLFGDTPFIRPETLSAMSEARSAGADVVVLGFEAADPGRYGRLVAEGDRLVKIVEWNDATEDERAIRLCNSGVVMADAESLFALLDRVEPSPASGEYYLTDIVGLCNADGGTARIVLCDEAETQGVNSRTDLAKAEETFQAAKRAEAIETGVSLDAPETVFFAHDTVIGRDAVIEPYVVFGPGVTVETGATIRAFSHLEGAHVGAGAVVGPYARLRPGAEIGNDAKIGNFVEIKAAEVGEGSKVNHLTYIGDATIGTGSNIGAGTVTCNYDGVLKHRTEIGDRVFIGSDTMLVAPVRIGDDAMTGSGSVITRNVSAGALALARAPQEEKPGRAVKIMEALRALKASGKKETG